MRPLPLAAPWLLAAACASSPLAATADATPTEATGEVGLAELREALGLLPPAGTVERDAQGAWLVSAAGHARIAAIPAGDFPCTTDAQPESWAEWRLFEGAPGAALAFDGAQVHVYWYDAAKACVTWAEVLQATPSGEAAPVASVAWSFLRPTDGKVPPEDDAIAAAAVVAANTRTAPLALPGQATPAVVRLTPQGVSVVAATGEVLFADGLASLRTGGCGSSYTAGVERVAGPDGAVHLHVTAQATFWEPAYPDDSRACTDDRVETSESLDAWVAFPSQGAPSVASRTATRTGAFGDGTMSAKARIPLPAGELRYEETSTSAGYEGRNGDGSERSWTWTFVAPSGAAADLAHGPHAP